MRLSDTYSNRSVNRTLGLMFGAFAAVSAPANAAANSDYDNAVSCAGGLQFMVEMLAAGSDPAKDASSRSAIWTSEAKRLGSKTTSGVEADIRAALDQTKVIMMGGDDAAKAAHFGPLNEICSKLPTPPVAPAKLPNPFESDNPTALQNHRNAVVCAGRYKFDATQGDEDAMARYLTFETFAHDSQPDLDVKILAANINQTMSEWMMVLLNDDMKTGMSVIDLCNRGYDNLK